MDDKKNSRPGRSSSLPLLPLVAIAILTSIYANPLEYFWDAGSASYYQARIAFQRSGPTGKAAIAKAAEDGKITLHEYSSAVFPAYLRVTHDGEILFPVAEQQKSVSRLKAELLEALD